MAFVPLTPENLHNCPPTPKITHPLPDSSESEGEQRSSDVERCSICLGKCRNKCFTDSCLHYFCFNCLLEWSKIKAECPLCKASFRSIIHNIKSLKEFDEYLVRPQTPPIQHSIGFPYLPHLPIDPQNRVYHRVNYMLSEPARYTYRATMQVRPQQSEQIYQLFMQSNPETERYSREYANDIIPIRQHAQEWRQYIYNRGIYALPLDDITGRSRECSVEFYRENPAQIHRLMPWINRELVVLLRGNPYQIQVVMDYLQELLTQYDITSHQFRAYFSTFLGSRTDHFIHELLNFARSPYDMMGYDRNVRYAPYYRPENRSRRPVNDNEEVVISSDNESNSPQDLSSAPQDLSYSRQRNNGRTEFTISTRLSHSTVIFRGSIESNPSASNASTSTANQSSQQQQQQPQIQQQQSISADDAEVAAHNERALGSNGTVQITRNVHVQSLTDSSSDECEFVLERKPPHLRTPEMVSLNSESDSDVVFVNTEQKTPPRRATPPPGVFEQSKNCSASDSDDNKCLTVLKMKLTKSEPHMSASTEPVPSTSSATQSNEVISLEKGRKPLRFRLKKRTFKSIYESSSDPEEKMSDNLLIPTVQYSNSSTDDESPIIARKPNRQKRKRSSSSFNKKKLIKKRKMEKCKKRKSNSGKKPRIKSVIVKNNLKTNSFYVAKGSVNENEKSSDNLNSSSDEDESCSFSERNYDCGNTSGWSTSSDESE